MCEGAAEEANRIGDRVSGCRGATVQLDVGRAARDSGRAAESRLPQHRRYEWRVRADLNSVVVRRCPADIDLTALETAGFLVQPGSVLAGAYAVALLDVG